MNKELLEEINKGNISKVALFSQDKSPILYTEKYVEEKDKEIERLNNIIVKLKKVLWQRCEEARKNEQYVRLNCYKDILNELVNTIYEADGETNE